MTTRNVAYLIDFAAIALLGGLIQQLATHTPPSLLQSGLPYGLITLALMFAWYRRDANERGYQRTFGLNVMIVACAIIALPYYLFRSRGFTRGATATLKLLGITIGYVILTGIGRGLAFLFEAHT